MRTINLTSRVSDLKYAIIHFPDGEVMVRLEDMDRKEEVEVLCRITNAQDLFILMQVGDILNRWEVRWHLKIFYLMSMRMDRVISFQEPFNLKIVTNVINGLKPASVSVYHPHSLRTWKLLDSYEYMYSAHPNSILFTDTTAQLCFPDMGAQKRYKEEYKSFWPVLTGKKVRDTKTGQITSIEVANPEDYKGGDVIVIDDLCDAGGTFLGIAEAIHKLNPDAKLHIHVIHMVNRIGIDKLSKVYETVNFTNTYRDWEDLPANCKMYDVINKDEGTK